MSPDHLFALMLERFKLREWALAASPVLGSTADAAKRCVSMMEEFLRLCVHLVSFTPSQPKWMSTASEVLGCVVISTVVLLWLINVCALVRSLISLTMTQLERKSFTHLSARPSREASLCGLRSLQ